jgi:FdrA protein
LSLHCSVFPNLYMDSVSLMQVSARLSALPGVSRASVAMATPANIERMRDSGMAVEVTAKPSDLLVAWMAEDAQAPSILEAVRGWLKPVDVQGGDAQAAREPSCLEMGLEAQPDANLALISVPGQYAAAEAMKALRLGMNVMLFSDNVPEAEEASIKTYASAHDLLVMGPDCGTAIVNGMPLGFANVVRPGAIGLVAASGTGLQELTCRIHHLGEGVSQALGTGGRDLHEEIGGRSMCQAIAMLAQDPATRLIVLLSKPPAPAVARRVLQVAGDCGKPVVVHFLGADVAQLEGQGFVAGHSLQHLADVAVATLRGQPIPKPTGPDPARLAQALAAVRRMASGQTDLRGVFAGGTFCYEAQLALVGRGLACESNAPVKGARALQSRSAGHGHSLLDMGDDEFTQGRPHPMIDPSQRNARLLQDADNPGTAVVLFDVVLGFGASAEPVGGLLPLLQDAQGRAEAAGRHILFIAHVCGTELDPQPRQACLSDLRGAGVLVADSNMEAAQLAVEAILALHRNTS